MQKNQEQDVIKNIRLYEKLKTNSMKLNPYIIYIISCKKRELIPTFGAFKTAKLVIETEIQYHLRKRQKDIRLLAMFRHILLIKDNIIFVNHLQ